MAKKSRFDGKVVRRTTDPAGYVAAFDENDRLCWDNENPERIVLTEDLRKYGHGLYKGQLGWTVPGSTDGYKWIDVQFDSGPCISVLTYGLERVLQDKAEVISQTIIESWRGTRFDADTAIAEAKQEEYARVEFGAYIDSDDLVQIGTGPQEVYAFTFPSLVELALLKCQSQYPVKVGYTADGDMGTFARVRTQIIESAAYPERVKLLVILRCKDGRAAELELHRQFRTEGRKVQHSVGREWFFSNAEEIRQRCISLREDYLFENSSHGIAAT